MRKREAQSAVYASKNPLVACGLREPFADNSPEPLVLSLRMFPDFNGRLAIKAGGGHITIACRDQASKIALLSAIEDALASRNLDERRWRDSSEKLEQERKEGLS